MARGVSKTHDLRFTQTMAPRKEGGRDAHPTKRTTPALRLGLARQSFSPTYCPFPIDFFSPTSAPLR